MFKLNCWIFNVTLVSDIPIYYAIIWYEDLQCSSRVQHVLDPACTYTEKSQTVSSLRRRILQVDDSRRTSHLKTYLKTHGYIFFCLVIRQMEWEQFFWENEARQRAALHQEKKKKKSNKLFDSHNARIVSVIFSPAQCCWCGSGCWWHAENVLHSFLRELVSKSLGGFLILLHQNRTRSS